MKHVENCLHHEKNETEKKLRQRKTVELPGNKLVKQYFAIANFLIKHALVILLDSSRL